MKEFLQETEFLDYNSIQIKNFLYDIPNHLDTKTIAINLYYKVRDGFIYDPYHLNLTCNALKSSVISVKKRAWCVEKAILLAACLRFFNIPSRLGFAIVTNHLGIEKLESYLKKKEIVFHGYVEIYLDNKWIKCTPAFDKRICKLSNVSPLEWDGMNDSLFQEMEGDKRFMEYIHDYGQFSDVPIELMNSEMKKHYPHLFEKSYNAKEFSFFHL